MRKLRGLFACRVRTLKILLVAAVCLATFAVPAAASAASARRACTISTAWVAVLGTNNNVYFCGTGTANTTGLGPFTDMTSTVLRRIWFHQHANGTGWADCFRGRLSFHLLGRDRNPGNIQVVANTAACP